MTPPSTSVLLSVRGLSSAAKKLKKYNTAWAEGLEERKTDEASKLAAGIKQTSRGLTQQVYTSYQYGTATSSRWETVAGNGSSHTHSQMQTHTHARIKPDHTRAPASELMNTSVCVQECRIHIRSYTGDQQARRILLSPLRLAVIGVCDKVMEHGSEWVGFQEVVRARRRSEPFRPLSVQLCSLPARRGGAS